MAEIKRGQILDIDFNPVKGAEKGKVRPCVVVTNDIYNKRVPLIQVVPLTSWNQKKSLIVTNVEVHPTEDNGLDMKSVADCLQTRPVDYRQRLVKTRGKLSDKEMRKIEDALRFVFDLR